MIKDNYNSCAGASSPGDGEKPRGCRTAGRQGVKSNQKEKYEVKPPEKDLFQTRGETGKSKSASLWFPNTP